MTLQLFFFVWAVAPWICSKHHLTAFLYSSHVDFSQFFLLESRRCNSYSSTNTVTAWKESCFILSDRSDSHLIDNHSIAVHAFFIRMLTSNSVDEILLQRYMDWSINFQRLAS